MRLFSNQLLRPPSHRHFSRKPRPPSPGREAFCLPSLPVHKWRTRPTSLSRSCADAALQEHINRIHAHSRGTYGRPRIHASLRTEDTHVSGKRIARLMRLAGLVGVSRRKQPARAAERKETPPAPDLVHRQFTASGPNKLWVADITEVPTQSGFLFLAVVLDAWSRRVVGWAMATHLSGRAPSSTTS